VSDLPKDIEKYGDALIKAWEQYLKIIDILIALSGATALVMVNLFKEVGLPSLKTPYGVIAVSSFGLALLFLALWRFASQHFYEYETIGGNEASHFPHAHCSVQAFSKPKLSVFRQSIAVDDGLQGRVIHTRFANRRSTFPSARRCKTRAAPVSSTLANKARAPLGHCRRHAKAGLNSRFIVKTGGIPWSETRAPRGAGSVGRAGINTGRL
jgi:hypothetical protein